MKKLLFTILVVAIVLMAEGISAYGKGLKINFIVIPQNGHELLTENGELTDPPVMNYLHAIEGIGQEDLFYGL